jgi:hypothetical protein
MLREAGRDDRVTEDGHDHSSDDPRRLEGAFPPP